MAKNVLLLVSGMTPQIITETVWALACDPKNDEKWVPHEIQVVTTAEGIKKVKETLLGANSIFQKMCDEYHLPYIQFDENSLTVITDNIGSALEDLKTPNDNEYAANAICKKVRELTQDGELNLYVSIAGGRKTMGFYAGYALSLYGRAQDRMSHVLVSSEFETLRGFFYPAKMAKQTIIRTHIKKIQDNIEIFEEVQLDTFNAKVWLADIPFVRLRASLPEGSLIKQASFSEIVETINLANQPIRVVLNVKAQTVSVGDKSIRLSSREFSFYHWFADCLKNGLPQIIAPSGDIEISKTTSDVYPEIKILANQYLSFYEIGRDEMDAESVAQTLEYGMSRSFFDERKANIRKVFKKKFGDELANKIEIDLMVKNAKKNDQELSKEQKKSIMGQYSLNLMPEQIEIIEN